MTPRTTSGRAAERDEAATAASGARPVAQPAVTEPPKERGLTARVLLLALVLIPLNCYWIIQMERVRQGPYVTSISLFANVVFLLLLFLIGNAALRRVRPGLVLRRGELLLLYVMLSVASGFCGMDMIQVLMQIIAFPFYFANEQNRWESHFFHLLPTWLTVRDPAAITPFFRGQSTLYTPAHLAAWLLPTLAWTAFGTLLMFVLMCVNVLARKQWVDRERLTFPVVQLPLVMIDQPGTLFRSRLMWGGFAIAFGINLLNGLAFLFPALPAIQVTQTDISPLVPSKPWSAIGWTPIAFYPFAIGLGFLLPVDLLFSCWFFYLYWKLQLVISNAMAWDVTPRFPFVPEQVFGAVIAIAASLLWASRGTFREIARAAARGKTDAREAISYRAALLGLGLGMLALIGFAVAGGMAPHWAILFFTAYLLICLVITRIRAELGPPVHDFHLIGPDRMMIVGFGSRAFGGGDLGMIALFWWFNRAYRGHPQPHALEGLKMADRTGTRHREVLLGVMLAAALGVFASIWAFVHLGYQLGTAAKFWSGHGYGWDIYNRLNQWTTAPEPGEQPAVLAMGFGAAGALLLSAMRARFFGWPFHPIGYAISGSWSMNLVWLPLFIAWVAKLVTLRYGGLRLYRQFLPFFLGLILGDVTMGTLWSLIGILIGTPTYNFWGA
jgi:hypothetical protein